MQLYVHFEESSGNMRYRRRLHRRETKRQRKIIILSLLTVLLCFSFGYAAFSTNIKMNAKGNLKNIDKEVDSKVSMSELLFWGEADNKDNTLITLKNKVSTGTDGAMHGFQNDFLSGYNDGNIIFDGNDDYIDIGLTNYDFKNTVSYIVYVKLNNIEKHQIIFGSWEGEKGASGIYFNNRNDDTKGFVFDVYDGVSYHGAVSKFVPNTNKYYTVVGTYDNNNSKIYIDGQLYASASAGVALGISGSSEKIGCYDYFNNGSCVSFASMSLKEVMLYDRVLTENEAIDITKGFEKNIVCRMYRKILHLHELTKI